MGELIAEAFEAKPVTGLASLKLSLKKAARELAVSAVAAGVVAVLGFLADPIALSAVLKDPPPQLLLLIPAVNFAAKLAIDQFRHRFLPWLQTWADER